MGAQKQTARAIIINQNNDVLLIERHNQGQHYFVLPGGAVEVDETPEQAAIREVLEETGLRVTIKNHVRTETDNLGNLQHIYACNYFGGEPKLQPGSIEARLQSTTRQTWRPAWFGLADLRHKTVYPIWLPDVLPLAK